MRHVTMFSRILYLLWLAAISSCHNIDRRLQSNDFVPLSCNDNVASAPCIPWSQMFGEMLSHDERVFVPCGQCVSFDLQEIRFNDGLDVRGKLEIASIAKIETTAIFVQGELAITSTKAVNGIPDVTITMIGDNESQSFVSINENANKCFGGVCYVGQKGIVVAGGTLNRT